MRANENYEEFTVNQNGKISKAPTYSVGTGYFYAVFHKEAK